MTTDKNKNLIQQLEEELLQPGVRHNQDRVAELLADEFREINSVGISLNKRQVLDSLTDEPATQRSISDFKVLELVPDVVLATYTLARGASQIRSQRSSIWQFKEGRWQMLFHQGTRIVAQSA